MNQPLPGEQNSTLTVDEGATIRLNEIWTEFELTTQQVHETAEAKHPEHTTAVTLARRAAQYLALGQDIVIFQGANGYAAPFFAQNVRYRTPLPSDGGLLSLQSGPYAPNVQGGPYVSTNPVIQVSELPAGSPPGVTYGENTLDAVTQAYSVLTAQGNPGPFALILNTVPFADLYAAVGIGSLVITADRVEPLVKAGLFGTGTLPADQSLPISSPPNSPPVLRPLRPLVRLTTACWFPSAETQWTLLWACTQPRCSCSRISISSGDSVFWSGSHCGWSTPARFSQFSSTSCSVTPPNQRLCAGPGE